MNKIVKISSLAGLALATTAFGQNTSLRLTNGTATYDPGAGSCGGTIPTTSELSAAAATANMYVSGTACDNLYGNWWWYRVNGSSTRELAVRQTSGTAVRTSTGANNVSYAITTTAALSFDVSYTLNQWSATSATVTYSLTVRNTSAGALDVSVFNWVDYFLANADAADRMANAVFSPGVGVQGNRIINVSDSSNAAYGMSHYGYNSNGYSVGSYTLVGGQISDSGVDNFNDVNNDVTFAPAAGQDIGGMFQWNLGSIAAGGSATVSAAIVVWNTVPTPGSAALLGAGMLASMRRRRA